MKLFLYTRRISACRTIGNRWSGSRKSSSAPSPILRRDIAAPHCGSIRILSLNSPTTRNAISRQLLSELREHVRNIAQEGTYGQTRALILASNIDSSFCAGADLKERVKFSHSETQSFLTDLRATFAELAELPVPTITAISSLALGGGLELALATNMRVFASTATVALPESRLGIVPGAGGTYRLPALIGRARALDMMLTGRRVAASEAYFFGLCDRLIPVDLEDPTGNTYRTNTAESDEREEARLLARARESVLHATIDLAREICGGGPVATRKILEAVSTSIVSEESVSGQSRENQAYEGVVNTEDRNEALKAFRDKRKPSFRGR